MAYARTNERASRCETCEKVSSSLSLLGRLQSKRMRLPGTGDKKGLSLRGAKRRLVRCRLGEGGGHPARIQMDCRARQAGLAMTDVEFISRSAATTLSAKALANAEAIQSKVPAGLPQRQGSFAMTSSVGQFSHRRCGLGPSFQRGLEAISESTAVRSRSLRRNDRRAD